MPGADGASKENNYSRPSGQNVGNVRAGRGGGTARARPALPVPSGRRHEGRGGGKGGAGGRVCGSFLRRIPLPQLKARARSGVPP